MPSHWRKLLRPLQRTAVGEALAHSRLRPQHWKASYAAARNLWFKYGHLRSVRVNAAVDADGEPVPWYTYPAIEFVKQFDLSDKSVFEYGAGNSTLFWSRRAACVVSVEDEEKWVDALRQRLPANATLILEPDLRSYVDVIARYPQGFDIIVVDGPARGRTRLKCARAAVEHLRPGGMIILDNSDWLPLSTRMLRDAGLLQVDMSGFIPIGSKTQTTSFFFRRDWQFRASGDRQPQMSAGAARLDLETEHPMPGRSLSWDDENFYGVFRHQVIDKTTEAGVRRFEVAAYDGFYGRRLVLYDTKRARVVVGPYPFRVSDAAVDAELARLAAMTWDEFRAFVNDSEFRRYVVDPIDSAAAHRRETPDQRLGMTQADERSTR